MSYIDYFQEEFAGIDIDYPKVYASQIGISEDSLSEEICTLLSEDINHKLRTIIGVRKSILQTYNV